MATGDAAAAAGMDLVAPTGLVNAGYTEINKTRDYVAAEQAARVAADALKLDASKITVQPASAPLPSSPNVGDLLFTY